MVATNDNFLGERDTLILQSLQSLKLQLRHQNIVSIIIIESLPALATSGGTWAAQHMARAAVPTVKKIVCCKFTKISASFWLTVVGVQLYSGTHYTLLINKHWNPRTIFTAASQQFTALNKNNFVVSQKPCNLKNALFPTALFFTVAAAIRPMAGPPPAFCCR